jgi:predicted GNAT family acetyltransferase
MGSSPVDEGNPMSNTNEVADDHANHRFVVEQDEGVAQLVYRERGEELVLVHTEVPEALGGRGLGGTLVQAAVDRAAREGLTLVPYCPYASSWLRKHPDEVGSVKVDWTPPPTGEHAEG